MTNLARRHRIQVYSIAIPVEPYTDLSLSLERFTFNSGGLSFYVTQKSSLMTYVGLLDSLREIQRRTQIAGPYLVSLNLKLESNEIIRVFIYLFYRFTINISTALVRPRKRGHS